MEDPEKEIANVVKLITTAVTPDIQRDAIQRFFTRDAGFTHPLCIVPRGVGSRDSVLGIYQWYRCMSPELGLEVDDFVYDKDKLKVFLNITQTFHIFLSPFKPASCRLVVQLTLEQLDGRYFIAHQNDFYNPQDFINLIIPPLSIFIFIALRFGAIASNINALLFQVLGLWRPKYK